MTYPPKSSVRWDAADYARHSQGQFGWAMSNIGKLNLQEDESVLDIGAGDGKITAFNPTTGATLGQLTGSNGQPIKISGLWALTFGNGGQGGTKDTLYFTAGPQAYAHGWLGNIVFVP